MDLLAFFGVPGPLEIILILVVVATIVGIMPGTVGVVVLGDAIGGDTSPTLLALSAACLFVGVLGLVVDARLGVPAGPEMTLEESRASRTGTGHEGIKP